MNAGEHNLLKSSNANGCMRLHAHCAASQSWVTHCGGSQGCDVHAVSEAYNKTPVHLMSSISNHGCEVRTAIMFASPTRLQQPSPQDRVCSTTMPEQRAEKRALHEEVVHLRCYLPMRPWHIRGRCQNGSEMTVISPASLAEYVLAPVQSVGKLFYCCGTDQQPALPAHHQELEFPGSAYFECMRWRMEMQQVLGDAGRPGNRLWRDLPAAGGLLYTPRSDVRYLKSAQRALASSRRAILSMQSYSDNLTGNWREPPGSHCHGCRGPICT